MSGDKEDSRTLHITIHKPSTNMHARPIPLLSARFIFDDHIRCMAAKQRLTKGRLRARQRKMQMIARLLELPSHIVDSIFLPSANIATSAVTLRTNQSSGAIPGQYYDYMWHIYENFKLIVFPCSTYISSVMRSSSHFGAPGFNIRFHRIPQD